MTFSKLTIFVIFGKFCLQHCHASLRMTEVRPIKWGSRTKGHTDKRPQDKRPQLPIYASIVLSLMMSGLLSGGKDLVSWYLYYIYEQGNRRVNG